MFELVKSLKPPTSVQLTDVKVTSDSATLTWTKNEDIDFNHYKVFYGYISTIGKTGFIQIYEKIDERDTTRHTFSDLEPGTRYWFWVTVYDHQDLEAKSNVMEKRTPIPAMPDLRIANIIVSPMHPIIDETGYATYTVEVTITNIGKQGVNPVWDSVKPVLSFRFSTGDVYYSDKNPENPIVSKGSWTHEAVFQSIEGTFILEIEVDPFNCLKEFRENNNKESIEITVFKTLPFNLVQNPSFEGWISAQPPQPFVWYSGKKHEEKEILGIPSQIYRTTDAHSGSYAVQLGDEDPSPGHGIICQDIGNIIPNMTYELSLWAKGENPHSPNIVTARAYVWWLDEKGNYLNADPIMIDLTMSRTTAYQPFSARGTAPAGARYARIQIGKYSWGYIRMDDVSLICLQDLQIV